MQRDDGRSADQMRPVTIEPGYLKYPAGSVLISTGQTRVLCSASVEEGVPTWMERNEVPGGWVTAEYAMLPPSTQPRTPREVDGWSGRTQEIRRLIGRSLRAAVDLVELGSRTLILDCDVLQADGGTRTASITGSYVALSIALQKLIDGGKVSPQVFSTQIAATSVGILSGRPLLDLCYQEDAAADVDINVVMTADMDFVEIQGTAEGATFSKDELDEMLGLAEAGIQELLDIQNQVLS